MPERPKRFRLIPKKSVGVDQDRQLSPSKRGYGRRWQRESKFYLAEHPLCVLCLKKDHPKKTAAICVDHIIPHKGNPMLFWEVSNWQSLCGSCHAVKTATEDGGFGHKRKKAAP